MENLDFNLDAFLEGLTNEKQDKPSFLQRLSMNSRSNKGTAIFIPIPESTSGAFYLKLPGVIELYFPTKLLRENEETYVWHKILPKNYYTFTSKENEELYDKVILKYAKIKNSTGFGENSYEFCRERSYSLFYGYLLSHVNESGMPVEGTIDKASLLIYPTTKPLTALSSTISNKRITTGGQLNWLSRYFNKNQTQRKGAVSINFTGGKGGYNASVGFESNSEDNPNFISSKLDLTSSFELCKDFIGDFLSWQSDEGYFRAEIFKEIDTYLNNFVSEPLNNLKTDFPNLEVPSGSAPF